LIFMITLNDSVKT